MCFSLVAEKPNTIVAIIPCLLHKYETKQFSNSINYKVNYLFTFDRDKKTLYLLVVRHFSIIRKTKIYP